MKTPKGLQDLIDEGVIDQVLRPLKSGKEASVYVVRSGDDIRCAKVYKDMAQRSFQARVQYQEGRKVRGSRQARAMGKATKFGRKEAEAAWKNAEVDALYQLTAAGVRVPKPYGYFNGVLVMELVTDADGYSAPRLGEVELSADTARDYHRFLMQQVARMLCVGLIHGDLSEYNVLVGPEGPVIIDLPQVVSASGNNSARTMLRRDVGNITISLSRFAPELLDTHYAEEMWALFELGELHPDTELTGHFEFDESIADVDSVMQSIIDARLGRSDHPPAGCITGKRRNSLCDSMKGLTFDLSGPPKAGPLEGGVRRRILADQTRAHWPSGGCQSSTLFPSGSMTQPNLPYSESSVFSSTLQPSSRSA
jgi:RIO kinase 1